MTHPSSSTWNRRLLLASVLLMCVSVSLSIAVSQILLGVSLALLVLGARRHGVPRTGLEGPSLALLIWAVGMVPLSTDPAQSLGYLRRFYLFAALWTVAAVAVDEKRRRLMYLCLAGGATVLSGWSLLVALAGSGGLFDRRMGEMSNPMTSGCLLMMALLVVGAALVTSGVGRRLRWLSAAIAVPVGLGLVQTITRSAWLGLLVGVWAMATALRPRRALVFGCLGLGLLAAVSLAPEGVLPANVVGRLRPDHVLAGRSTNMRLDIWRGGLAMVRSRPLTGVGDCDLEAVTPQYYGDDDTYYHGHMHSNPLMFAVIWGLPGFLLAMVLLVWQLAVLVRHWRRWRGSTDPGTAWTRIWLLGAVGVWAGFFVAGLTEWYFGDAESLHLYMLILGAALGCAHQTQRPPAV